MKFLLLFMSWLALCHYGASTRQQQQHVRRNQVRASNELDDVIRQRVRIHPFEVQIAPVNHLTLTSNNEIALVLEKVVNAYVRTTQVFDESVKFDEVLLRCDNGLDSSQQQQQRVNFWHVDFKGGAVSFEAPSHNLLPTSEMVHGWIKVAVQEQLVGALQQDGLLDNNSNAAVATYSARRNNEVTQPPPPSSSSSQKEEEPSDDTTTSGGGIGFWAIVGIVVGGCAVVAAIVVSAFYASHKKRHKLAKKEAGNNTMYTTSRNGHEEEEDEDELQQDKTQETEDNQVVTVEEQEQATTSSTTPSSRPRRLNLFTDFFQPFLELLYQSFGYFTRFTEPSSATTKPKTDLIADSSQKTNKSGLVMETESPEQPSLAVTESSPNEPKAELDTESSDPKTDLVAITESSPDLGAQTKGANEPTSFS